jgi:hypothetical protein
MCYLSALSGCAFLPVWKAAAGISAKRKPLLTEIIAAKTAAGVLLQQPKTRVADTA